MKETRAWEGGELPWGVAPGRVYTPRPGREGPRAGLNKAKGFRGGLGGWGEAKGGLSGPHGLQKKVYFPRATLFIFIRFQGLNLHILPAGRRKGLSKAV